MDLNESQKRIMRFIQSYIKEYNQPVPKKAIEEEGIDTPKMLPIHLRSLVKRGYIRMGITTHTTYVLLRSIY